MEEESGHVDVPEAAAPDVAREPPSCSDTIHEEPLGPPRSASGGPSGEESGLGGDATCADEPDGGGEEAPAADVDSLPGADELALAGCTGSDSGVEGCGRALSSGGGSRSCASSVVSCGSGCGSESSSLAAAPRPRPKRRVALADAPPSAAGAASPRARPSPPLGASTPRLVSRGPNLATRERARSREKPTPPEKPRPLTPKPRARPPLDLPALARESPALRAKPTRTSTARCRTPNSPTEDKRRSPLGAVARPIVGEAAGARAIVDKYATLPRRRRDGDSEGSPRRGASVGRDAPPPIARRPTVARAASSRGAARPRVRIYAETCSQTALTGEDVAAALGGRAVRLEATAPAAERVSRGVQADRRAAETERVEARLRRAQAELEEERARRERAESSLEEERACRRAAQDELERNTRRLLELTGGGAAGGATGGALGGAGECLRALEEQLRAAADLAAAHRHEIDRLRDTCRTLQTEASGAAAAARALERRLAEAEVEAAEMQDFLGAEKIALHESLRDAERELVAAHHELARRRGECRQLVRLCEQRRQEALAASARSRGGGAAGLDALARRLRALLDSLRSAHRVAAADLDDAIFYNEAYSRSDSGGARSPEEPALSCGERAEGAALLAAVASAMRARAVAVAAGSSESRDERSDNSAELLDSETEPCLVTDAAYEEGSTSPNPTYGLATDVSSIQVTESRRATRADHSSLCIEGEVRRLERGEDSCSSLHNLAAWSADELSPVPAGAGEDVPADPDGYDEASERESLRNLSAAILQRQRSEAECSVDDDLSRARMLDKVVVVDNLLTELLRVVRVVQQQGDASARQLDDIRERVGDTERNVAEAVSRKLAELDATSAMLQQYKQDIEELTARLEAAGDSPGSDSVEEEVVGCDGAEVRARYETLDACLASLAARQRVVAAWPRLAALQARLERLAFLLLAAHPATAAPHHAHTTHTIDSAA